MLYLGMVYKKDIYGNLVLLNHRSFIKILLNPLLRYFGYFINTEYCKLSDKIKGISVKRLSDKTLYKNIIENYRNSLVYPFNKDTMFLKKSRMFI